MKNIILMSIILSIGTFANVESFSEKKKLQELEYIKQVYKVKLRKKCRYSSAYFAQLHTQDEWGSLKSEREFKDEFELLCPKGKDVLDKGEMKKLYFFANEYAKGTGNYPKS